MLFDLKLLTKLKFYVHKNFSSALFITGDKAQQACAVLSPVIDFETQIENKDVFIKNINTRNASIDVDRLEKKWKFFQFVGNKINGADSARLEIGNVMSELLKIYNINEENLKKLKLWSKLMKDDLRTFKEFFYQLEENTILQILELPNSLHKKTSLVGSEVHKFLDKSNTKTTKSHMSIMEQNGYIEHINSLYYYFKSEAALFEISILNYFRHYLLKNGYIQFSNPGFCRSAIIEGCGESCENFTENFMLEESDKNTVNHLYLCGAATLYPFAAYFTRHSVYKSYFPFKCFSVGNNYRPHHNKISDDLFDLCQESVLNIFIAMSEDEDLLDKIIKDVIILYESLGYHFRLTILPANELKRSESLRLSIQMYSNILKNYVEVGNISTYETYLSKRLLFNYNINGQRKFPNIISGQLLNVPRLLGCIIENNSSEKLNLMTDLLDKYKFL